MGRTKRKGKTSRERPKARGIIRLPESWLRLARRMDVAGRLAERWAPTFQTRWLALTAVLFPLLLILLAFLLTPAR